MVLNWEHRKRLFLNDDSKVFAQFGVMFGSEVKRKLHFRLKHR